MTSYWSQNKVQTPLVHDQSSLWDQALAYLFTTLFVCYTHCISSHGHVLIWLSHRIPPEILLCSLLCLANAYAIFTTWLKHHQLLEVFHDPSHLQMRKVPTSVPSENPLLTSVTLFQSHSLIIPQDLWGQSLFLTSVSTASSILPGSESLIQFFWEVDKVPWEFIISIHNVGGPQGRQ